ncbi:hypothetical protein PTSG_06330 [Salpingoeca rosetta]|uniref:GxGYxYP putative glycoside hydrolase C-terminal domain-containing protein n=1 Tax=Salpingoeca rosetta (strain ATCC 50818 / BSB-021) TaxID=946362 RepID=F2UCL3_SALR5|nr:uncharacterized protein PTSG_06330 [Salpingoeca rosetta]EGD74320.1 hypothetical protein PTSG_06330 [Salpingoeca rosetta]|eukprot:XP_004993220.1 hypothetical protein PTSG_06330 [Salpingoeca rosetta]
MLLCRVHSTSRSHHPSTPVEMNASLLAHAMLVLLVLLVLLGMSSLMTTDAAAARFDEAAFQQQVQRLQAATAGQVFVYDSSWLLNETAVDPPTYYQTTQLLAAIQGIVNRDQPQLFLNHTPADAAWFPFIQQTWFKDVQFQTLDTVDDILDKYMQHFNGTAIYDTNVPSTSLVAASLAGAYNLLPVAFDPNGDPNSWYSQLVHTRKMRVAYNLTGKFDGRVTGSSKCDAYMWAIDELIRTGACTPHVHGYMIDYFWTGVASKAPRLGNTIPNQDYVIARRGFFWDLDVWQDQAPNDDPHQPLGTDYHTLVAIMNASNAQMTATQSKDEHGHMIHVVGFVPWAFKYVNEKHQGVATEWKMVQVLSAYNAFVDADACCIEAMANAAFYSTLPLPSRFVQQPPLSLPQLQSKGYVQAKTRAVVPRMYISFYVGDYDSAAWVYNELKARWDDGNRGSVPLGWAVDAELSWRFPPAFMYALGSTTASDRLISGDSGAGYLNPTQLLPPRSPSSYPSANASWIAHNIPLFRQFDMRFTGFLINGDAGAMTPEAERMYAPFSALGVVDELNPAQGAPTRLNGNMPVFSQQDLPSDGNATRAASIIAGRYNASNPNPQFFVWRNVLQTPTYYKQLVQEVRALAGDNVAVVDPHVLSALARAHLGGDTDHQVSYEPEIIAPLYPVVSAPVTVNMTVRNDGWGDISPHATLCAGFRSSSSLPLSSASDLTCVPLGVTVGSGERASAAAHLRAPGASGTYVLEYQLVLPDGRGLDEWGNPPVQVEVQVGW